MTQRRILVPVSRNVAVAQAPAKPERRRKSLDSAFAAVLGEENQAPVSEGNGLQPPEQPVSGVDLRTSYEMRNGRAYGITPYSDVPVPLSPSELANRRAPAEVLEAARIQPPIPPGGGYQDVLEELSGLVHSAIPGTEISRKAADLRNQGVGTVAAAEQAYRETDLPFGVKGLTEAAVDPLNLIPGPGGAKVAAKGARVAGKAAAKGATAAGRTIGEAEAAVGREVFGMGQAAPVQAGRRPPVSQPPAAARVSAVQQALPPSLEAPRVASATARGTPPNPPAQAIGGQPAQRPPSGFQLEPFEEPGKRLLGAETGFEAKIKNIPILRDIYGAIDPAAIHQTEPVANLGIKKMVYEETQKARGHAAVLDWYAEAKPLLGFDSKGIARNVRLAQNAPVGPASRSIHDIVENPSRYILTPEQSAVIAKAQSIMDSVLTTEQQAGVTVGEIADYWARQITSSPGQHRSLMQKLAATSGARAASTGHTQGRVFPTAEAAMLRGYGVNLDPVQSLTARIDAGIQAIANKETTTRIGNLPGVRAGDPAFGENTILGKAAPQELIDQIHKWIDVPGQPSTPEYNRITQEVLQAWRSTMTSFDLGSAFLQNQSTITRNPVAWARAMGAGLLSLGRQPLSYVQHNYQTIDRGIKNGAILPPSEFLFPDKGLASLPGRVPVVGAGLKASNRFMQWNIFVAQTELYKAIEGQGGKSVDELVKLSRSIRHATGGESYAILGVRPRQRSVEAIAAFAPRFMRGLTNTMFSAFTPGSTGNEARRAMAGVIGGMTALTVAASYATSGKAPNYTDPYKEDWARFRVGDSWVSAYGPFHNYFRTLARMGVSIADGEPDKAMNELRKFLVGKAGIGLRLAATGVELAIKGESHNFEGEPITVSPEGFLNFMKDQAPITPANLAKGIAEGRPEALLNVLNINNNPNAARNELVNQYFSAGEDAVPPDLQKVWREYRDISARENPVEKAEFLKRHPEIRPYVQYQDRLRDRARLDQKTQQALNERYPRYYKPPAQPQTTPGISTQPVRRRKSLDSAFQAAGVK